MRMPVAFGMITIYMIYTGYNHLLDMLKSKKESKVINQVCSNMRITKQKEQKDDNSRFVKLCAAAG